jgi:hypothetical protein
MQSQLKLTKDGQSGDLMIDVGRKHSWNCPAPIPWFPAQSGTWYRGRNATKFRQFSYLVLVDSKGTGVAHLPDQPWQPHSHLSGNLVDHLWIFEASGANFDALVVTGPPLTKKFRLRELFDGSVSYGTIGPAGELAVFQIVDPESNTAAIYRFSGAGIAVGLPKLPSIKNFTPSWSTPGPWNEFEAPGWMTLLDFEGDALMQAAALGFGSGYSYTDFQFVGHVENAVGYLCHIPDMSTGRTFSWPSDSHTSGSLTLTVGPKPFTGSSTPGT